MNEVNNVSCVEAIPYMLVKNGQVIKINSQFAEMTEYGYSALLNRRIEDVFRILRVGPNIDINIIDDKVDYFLFTKSLDIRFVNIQVRDKEQDKELIFLQRPDYKLDDKLSFTNILFQDNYYGIGIYSVPDNTLLRANEKYISIFNDPYKNKELCIGRTVWEFDTGFEGSSLETIWNDVLKTGKAYNVDEYMYEGFERGITYWRLSLNPVYIDNKIKYMIEMNSEITEKVLHRKKLEEQAKLIKKQKQELEAVLDNMVDGFSIIDKNGRYTRVNKTVRGWLEHEEINQLGGTLTNSTYYDMSGKELTLEELPGARVIKGEKIDKFKLLKVTNGLRTYYSISGNPIYDEDGNFIMGVLNTRDVTFQETQARFNIEQKEKFKAVLNNMPDPCAVYDKDEKLILLNAEAQKLYPTLKEKKTIMGAHELFSYTDLEGNVILPENLPTRRALRGEEVRNEIVVFKNGDKTIINAINSTPVFDEENNLVSVITSHRDITEFIKNQEEIRKQNEKLISVEKEKNEALKKTIEMKDEFLSIISHEFKTPLNVISTATQALNYICGNELSDRAKKYISIIRQNTFRQLRLVNNLLDITRADAGRIKLQKRNLDIVFLTKSIIGSVYTYASQKGVPVLFLHSVEKKIIGIDDEKYERILLNLLSNAIKFTPAGKDILVKLRVVKDVVKIEVKDNGIGIPTDKLGVIFDRFGQVDSSLSRQAEGAGIGLSLVKKFVEALGGSITVKSKEGKGSSFLLTLPAETVREEQEEKEMVNLMDNGLVENTIVEFSDIYL